jgi:FKBP-type peptidyl-prolyl cis-trans isomerase
MRSWERIEASRKAGAKPSADPLARPSEVPEPKKADAWASSGRSFGDVKRPFSSPKSVTESPPSSGNNTALATTGESASSVLPPAAQRAFEEAKAKASPDELARMEKLRIGAEDLKSMSEITKGLRKRILTVGEASDGGDARGRPPNGATVTIHYASYLYPDEGAAFASTREYIAPLSTSLTQREVNRETPPGPYTFTLGEGTVLPAWEIGVQTMRIGEKCELIAAPNLAYGEGGAEHLGVPPNYPIKFVLELLAWKQSWKPRKGMPAAERLDEAETLKLRGTNSFKASKWKAALESYDQAAYYLADGFFGAEYLKDASAEESIPTRLESIPTRDNPPPPPTFPEGAESTAQAKALLLSCMLNATQCCLKLEEWREAEAKASRVLQLDKKSVKALFRRGLARTKLGDYSDAKADLRRACELDPKSKEVREAFDEAKRAESEAKEATKRLYANTGAADGRGYEAPPPAEEDPLFVY